jgi:hypothetical protein
LIVPVLNDSARHRRTAPDDLRARAKTLMHRLRLDHR